MINPVYNGVPTDALLCALRTNDNARPSSNATQIHGYTLHDARHSWAVRAIRAGATFEVVRLQFGHSTTAQVATCYGRFVPTDEERTSWEAVAERQEGSADGIRRVV